MSLSDLETKQGQLKNILIRHQLMTKKGRILQGDEHPYRDAGHKMLDIYKALEIAICIKACRELRDNPNNADTRKSLLNLLRETREYIVIDTASKLFRRLDLRLRRPAKEVIRGWIDKISRRIKP